MIDTDASIIDRVLRDIIHYDVYKKRRRGMLQLHMRRKEISSGKMYIALHRTNGGKQVLTQTFGNII